MATISLKKENIYSKAVDKLEEGDYIQGINLLYRSASSRGLDNERRLDLAIAYYNIGHYSYALKEFFLVLYKIGDDCDVLKYIIQCFMEIGEPDSALYYFKYCLDKGIFEDEDFDTEEFDFLPQSNIEIFDKRDKTKEIQLAHKMIIAEQFDFAEELLKSVGKESYQYVDARNFLAMLSIALDKPEEALLYCDEVLALQPRNIMALSQKFTALDMLERIEERDEIIAQLRNMQINDVMELAKIAVSFKLIGDDVLTAEYFEKIISQIPFDRDYLICAAQAEYNCGEYAKAKKLIVDALRLFPYDATVRFYAMQISERSDEAKFEVLPIIPAVQTAMWLSDLDNLSHLSVSAFERQIKTDEMYDIKINWLFQNDFAAVQLSLVPLLSKIKKYQPLLKEFLLDPFANLRAKREILYYYMINNPYFLEIAITVNDRLKITHPQISVDFRNHRLFPAYCRVYSLLIMMEKKFTSKLNKAFEKVIQAESKLECMTKPNYNALAAVMLKFVMGKSMSEESCCDNMECDMTDFKVFEELIYGQ